MNCRDLREVADSFVSEALPPDTNREISWHLDSCASCRAEIGARRRLRGALRRAFDRTPEMRPRVEFADALGEQLRGVSASERRASSFSYRWLALAASAVLVAGLAGGVLLKRPLSAADALARDAIGDHRNCALKFRLVRTPVPLEEAAQRFDQAYRQLLVAPPDDISTADGPARVIDRHSCAYGARRFGHVVMQYRGSVVSLLMTATDATSDGDEPAAAMPHVIGRPMNGLSVVSVAGPRHVFLLVSDLERVELTRLSTAVALPLVQRLEGQLVPQPAPALALAALWR